MQTRITSGAFALHVPKELQVRRLFFMPSEGYANMRDRKTRNVKTLEGETRHENDEY